MYQSILKTISTSLIAGLIVWIIFISLQSLHRFSFGKRVYHYFSTQEKAITYLLVFALFSLPIMFSLHTGTWLSPLIAVSFVREAIVSAVVFASFYISWRVFNISVTTPIPSFDEILVQWDAGQVSDTKVKREQILYSLLKWIKLENETGWYELKEQVAGKLTDIPASWIIEKELNLIQKQKMGNYTPIRNHNYEKRLESLINLESVGVVWQKWDNDLVSEDVAYEALEVNAFKKWVLNNDETGWINLDYIRQDRKPLAPKVIKIAEYELQEIKKMEERNEEIDLVLKTRLEKIVLV